MEIPNPNPTSESSDASSSESEMGSGSRRRLGEMELDAARALADFAQISKIEKGDRDLNEHVYLIDDVPQGQKATEAVVEEKIKAEKNSESSISNISCTGSHVSCFGRWMKQNMTEAEREARRIRRVLANRESARQTIRRRQALRGELIKRVAELSFENENMKMQKELVMKEYRSLKDRNKELKEEIIAARAEMTSRQAEASFPSTELSLGAPLSSISTYVVASCNESGSSKACASKTQFYAPPSAWLHPLLHQTSSNKVVDIAIYQGDFINCPKLGDNFEKGVSSAEQSTVEEAKKINTGINLEELPIGFDDYDPGGSWDIKAEQEIGIEEADKTKDRPETITVPFKKLVDPASAAAARKRRKELTKLKYLHGRQQIRLHG